MLFSKKKSQYYYFFVLVELQKDEKTITLIHP